MIYVQILLKKFISQFSFVRFWIKKYTENTHQNFIKKFYCLIFCIAKLYLNRIELGLKYFIMKNTIYITYDNTQIVDILILCLLLSIAELFYKITLHCTVLYCRWKRKS